MAWLQVGSIGDNRLGGWYSYRSSKAALNQLTKTMSLEFERRRQKVSCILLHPGTCDTDLSRPFQRVSSRAGCALPFLFTTLYQCRDTFQPTQKWEGSGQLERG
jgi:NAD(P)-dependent dehydrogenase (short-subunit alcohol dehydrogenase family)